MNLAAASYSFFFFFKQKTAYEKRISDLSSDVCSSVLGGWNSYYAVAAPKIAAQFFPGIPAAQATARLNNDMNGMGAAGMASSSGQLVRQAMFINALSEARDGFASGSAQGAIDAFAQTRADIQTRNTYSTIAGRAMRWGPLPNIVLPVVFYSLFPIP